MPVAQLERKAHKAFKEFKVFRVRWVLREPLERPD